MASRQRDEDAERRLLDQYAARSITLVDLLDRLCAVAVPARYDPTGGEGYLPGTIDSLQRAVADGILGEIEWASVLERAESYPDLVAVLPLPTTEVVAWSPAAAPSPSPSDDPCQCLRLPDETDRPLPATWVAMHNEVRVVTKDGRRATGWTMGPLWAATPTGPELILEVDVEGAESVAFTVDEIATWTPVSGVTDLADFLTRVQAAVQRAAVTADPQPTALKLILDAHAELEVTAHYTRHPCEPMPVHGE